MKITVAEYINNPTLPKKNMYEYFLDQMHKELLPLVYQRCGSNASRAAKMLGITRMTLEKYMDKAGLPRKRIRPKGQGIALLKKKAMAEYRAKK